MTTAATERQFTIIGEAMARLDERHPIVDQIFDHKTIIGVRTTLAHRYPEIRNQEAWEIIQQKLPTLLNEVTNRLEQP